MTVRVGGFLQHRQKTSRCGGAGGKIRLAQVRFLASSRYPIFLRVRYSGPPGRVQPGTSPGSMWERLVPFAGPEQ